MRRPFVSITSDFGIGSEGVGVMKATVLKYAQDANVVDLTHEVEAFNIREGARELEALTSLPVGIHVCVVDPGVGTERRSIIILTKRGDYLIGPDNGVLIPAAQRLGGIKNVIQITNERYMQKPVSPTFHGRDIFCAAAGHLASGVYSSEFGVSVKKEDLVPAPYKQAIIEKGLIQGTVIHMNRHNFNVYSNIYDEQLAKLKLDYGVSLSVKVGKYDTYCPLLQTFGQAPKGTDLLFIDDYGHLAIGQNQGKFGLKYAVKPGSKFEIKIKC